MDRKRLLSPMKQQSFVLPHCGVGHTVGLKRADAVQAGAALAARLVAALVAAPRQLIGNLQPQTFGNDLRLVPTHERSLDADITARAEYDGVVHRIYKILTAVGIGIAGGIVVMRAVVNHAAVLGQRNAGRCRQEQTVARHSTRPSNRAKAR